VQRDDRRQGIAAARRLAGAVLAGESLVFFPEGTFTSVPGLRPFHLGAFVAAREAGVPVVPIAIRGTRAILWGDSWFPRRGAVTVTIGPSLRTDDDAGQPASAWQAAVAFRNRARAYIVSHCGEPDLAGTAAPHAPSPP
jgi:1-acyl-sn-glycerol-3-phosphate acyltransferase